MGNAMARRGAAALAALAVAGSAAWALDVGDSAPPIRVEKWLSNTPVSLESAKGKVLVVEFWATWCAPCRQTIPHLNELHKQYKDKEVVIVGITEEGEDVAKKFMHTMAMGYHVGVDEKSGTNKAYMANIPGIPHAFVVDRKGQVVWHGHPLRGMDAVIDQLVAGTFDLDRSKKLSELRKKFDAAWLSRDRSKALAVLDETIRSVADDPHAYRLKRTVLLQEGDADAAHEVLLAMAKGCPNDLSVLIEVAVTLCTSPRLQERDLGKSLELAKKAVEEAKTDKASSYAVLARSHYELGHLAAAAQAAAKSLELAEDDGDKKRLKLQLDFYRGELERRRKDPDSKL